jgi:hypothetical protein
MAVLVWSHGKTRDEAREIIRAELASLGYDSSVEWDGYNATASIGWGTLLDARVFLRDC